MKIVNHLTDYVLIKAKTTSEWDGCDFAIIDVSGDWKTLMRTRLERTEPFWADDTFFSHSYWERPLGFYLHRPPQDDELRIFLDRDEELNCVFVTLEQDEQEQLITPSSPLDSHLLIITTNGLVSYKAYGKHTGEEFYTEPIDAYELLIALKA